ncbi:maltose O-acetyltransferase [Pseudohyphozyma bogoriensis]|nr:maltose O-acetyltransferase [Pseudohyphozyma bogoriensis]
MPQPTDIDTQDNLKKMLAGELYYAFLPNLLDERKKASIACAKFNRLHHEVGRRDQLEMIREMVPSIAELPAKLDDPAEDEAQLSAFPWIEPPFRVDYGSHVEIGDNTFINFGMVVLDTCHVKIGSRVLFGPNVHLYAASHPLDPAIRKGLDGPENGKPITIEDDCWFGGNVTVCPGVTIGRGATIAAGSVVTKNVAPFTVVGGNPAKHLKDIESPWADEYFKTHPEKKRKA